MHVGRKRTADSNGSFHYCNRELKRRTSGYQLSTERGRNEVRTVGHHLAGPGFSHVEVAAAEPEKVTLEIASLFGGWPLFEMVCDGLVGTRAKREGACDNPNVTCFIFKQF
jgi:hypothetical protein